MTNPTERRPSHRAGHSRADKAVERAARAWAATQRYAHLRNRFTPTECISADELEGLHQATLRVLEEIGIDFLLPEARALLAKAGADVRAGSERVRFDRHLLQQLLSTCPSQFTLHARNPAHHMAVGGDALAFLQVASPPNATDTLRGRRAGNQADFRNFVKLAQSFDVIHASGGYPVEPVDIHASVRHLDCLYDIATLTDKPFHAYSLGTQRVEDAIEIARLARGISHEQLEREPSLFTIINSNSPLKLDTPMLQGIIAMAGRNQPIVLTPFTLAGAMAPVTLAGALVQQNAEALAGIAFSQVVRPGAPVVYGGFTSNVDMKSGAPAFGTPEYMKAALVSGQLARKYRLPFRSSNVNAANSMDAQAAYESVFSLWSVVQGGANFIMHAAGWLEGGLSASFEKFILDVDLLQMVAELLQPLDLSDDALGLSAMQDVGPGGHYFGTAHTLARFENAFYQPLISDWRNYETWHLAGSPTALDRARTLWQDTLARYEAPAMDAAQHEALKDFVQRRKAAGGVATDF